MARSSSTALSPTVYLDNLSRARRVDVSRDPYAALWVPTAQRDMLERLRVTYSASVLSQVDLGASIVSRYLFDWMQHFATIQYAPVFASVGAGFSSYPFLLQAALPVIEIDDVRLSARRQSMMNELLAEGLLPERNIRFAGMDLHRELHAGGLLLALGALLPRQPSFVLLAATDFWASREGLQGLAARLSELQLPGSLLALSYVSDPVPASHTATTTKERCNLDADFLCSLDGYRLEILSDAAQEEHGFTGSQELQGAAGVALPQMALLSPLH